MGKSTPPLYKHKRSRTKSVHTSARNPNTRVRQPHTTLGWITAHASPRPQSCCLPGTATVASRSSTRPLRSMRPLSAPEGAQKRAVPPRKCFPLGHWRKRPHPTARTSSCSGCKESSPASTVGKVIGGFEKTPPQLTWKNPPIYYQYMSSVCLSGYLWLLQNYIVLHLGVVANISCGQLNREKYIFLSPLAPENLVSRGKRLGCPVPHQPIRLLAPLRLNLVFSNSN